MSLLSDSTRVFRGRKARLETVSVLGEIATDAASDAGLSPLPLLVAPAPLPDLKPAAVLPPAASELTVSPRRRG